VNTHTCKHIQVILNLSIRNKFVVGDDCIWKTKGKVPRTEARSGDTQLYWEKQIDFILKFPGGTVRNKIIYAKS